MFSSLKRTCSRNWRKIWKKTKINDAFL